MPFQTNTLPPNYKDNLRQCFVHTENIRSRHFSHIGFLQMCLKLIYTGTQLDMVVMELDCRNSAKACKMIERMCSNTQYLL